MIGKNKIKTIRSLSEQNFNMLDAVIIAKTEGIVLRKNNGIEFVLG